MKQMIEDDEGESPRYPFVLLASHTSCCIKSSWYWKSRNLHLNSVQCVYRGVSYNAQQKALSRVVDVLGTPGRLIGLVIAGYIVTFGSEHKEVSLARKACPIAHLGDVI